LKKIHLNSILQKKLVTKTLNKGVKGKISIVISKILRFWHSFCVVEIQKWVGGGGGVISAFL
jgi:hypothetical protein